LELKFKKNISKVGRSPPLTLRKEEKTWNNCQKKGPKEGSPLGNLIQTITLPPFQKWEPPNN